MILCVPYGERKIAWITNINAVNVTLLERARQVSRVSKSGLAMTISDFHAVLLKTGCCASSTWVWETDIFTDMADSAWEPVNRVC